MASSGSQVVGAHPDAFVSGFLKLSPHLFGQVQASCAALSWAGMGHIGKCSRNESRGSCWGLGETLHCLHEALSLPCAPIRADGYDLTKAALRLLGGSRTPQTPRAPHKPQQTPLPGACCACLSRAGAPRTACTSCPGGRHRRVWAATAPPAERTQRAG